MYEDDSKLDKLKETVYIYIFKKIARCHITPHNAVCHITVSNNTHTHVYIPYLECETPSSRKYILTIIYIVLPPKVLSNLFHSRDMHGLHFFLVTFLPCSCCTSIRFHLCDWFCIKLFLQLRGHKPYSFRINSSCHNLTILNSKYKKVGVLPIRIV